MNIFNYFKVDKAGKLAIKFVSMILFRKKYFFRFEYEAFLTKNKKNFVRWKKDKRVFLRKKNHVFQNWIFTRFGNRKIFR